MHFTSLPIILPQSPPSPSLGAAFSGNNSYLNCFGDDLLLVNPDRTGKLFQDPRLFSLLGSKLLPLSSPTGAARCGGSNALLRTGGPTGPTASDSAAEDTEPRPKISRRSAENPTSVPSRPHHAHSLPCFLERTTSDDDNDAGTSSDSASVCAAAREATRPLSPAASADNFSGYVGPIPEPVSFTNGTAYGSYRDHHGNLLCRPLAGTSTWRRRGSENGLRHCGGGGAFQIQGPSGSVRRSSTGGIGGRAALYGRHSAYSGERELTDIDDEVRSECVCVGTTERQRRRRVQTTSAAVVVLVACCGEGERNTKSRDFELLENGSVFSTGLYCDDVPNVTMCLGCCRTLARLLLVWFDVKAPIPTPSSFRLLQPTDPPRSAEICSRRFVFADVSLLNTSFKPTPYPHFNTHKDQLVNRSVLVSHGTPSTRRISPAPAECNSTTEPRRTWNGPESIGATGRLRRLAGRRVGRPRCHRPRAPSPRIGSCGRSRPCRLPRESFASGGND